MNLLQCPFCGSKNLIEDDPQRVYCKECTSNSCAIIWNNRYSTTREWCPSATFELMKCQRAFNELYEKHRWISIKNESPPELNILYTYIVTIYSSYKRKNFVEPLHYIDGEWFTMIDEEPLDMEYEVTHWMPLPSLPEK